MPAERLRILHLIHSSAFGGGPAMVELLCRRLHGDEFEMSLVTSNDGEMPAQLAALGMRVELLPLATKQSFARAIPELAGVIRRQAPDLVHVHGHFAASLGQIAIQLAGLIPTIYSVQWPAYLDDDGPYSRVRNWVAERVACGLARRVVAVSDHDRDSLLQRRLCAPAKLTRIYNSYDPRRIQLLEDNSLPLRGREGWGPPDISLPPRGRAGWGPHDGPLIGFIGRLADQKGCEFLVRAMPEVVAAHPTARLAIVGDGPQRDQLQSLARDLGQQDAVEFLGYQPVTPALLDAMDAVVIPSIYEPLGIVALEAMARARPVVASAVGGLQEVVEDGKTGLLVPPGHVGDLVRAITRLLDSAETRSAMGRAGLQRVRDHFSPDVCVAAYAAEYRALANRSRRRARTIRP